VTSIQFKEWRIMTKTAVFLSLVASVLAFGSPASAQLTKGNTYLVEQSTTVANHAKGTVTAYCYSPNDFVIGGGCWTWGGPFFYTWQSTSMPTQTGSGLQGWTCTLGQNDPYAGSNIGYYARVYCASP
jgi:hypothetical protein